MKNQITCLLWTAAILINSTSYAEFIDYNKPPIKTTSPYETKQEDTPKQSPQAPQGEANTAQEEQKPDIEQKITMPTETETHDPQLSTETHKPSIEPETERTNRLGAENHEPMSNREIENSSFTDQQATEQSQEIQRER